MSRKDETSLGSDEFGRVTVRFGEATPILTFFAYSSLDDLEADITLNEEQLQALLGLLDARRASLRKR